jgi:TonB family protein
MAHGSQEYFRERARFERRLSLTVASVSLVLLACEYSLLLPEVRQSLLARFLENRALAPRRFGFEGPEQYVRRITLETNGPPGPSPGRPLIYYQSARTVKGGRSQRKTSTDPHGRPDTRPPGIGPGESTADLMARARVLYGGSAPVMQSEDLIIERLVKPEYPPDARDRNVEGRVALVALVDTTGAIAHVDLMSSTGETQLVEAATAAVRQCRFRPYRVNGRLTEVYAVFRFSFRIY